MIATALRRSVLVTVLFACIDAAPAFAQATAPASSTSATPSKRCHALNAKVAREEKALAATTEAVVKDRRARETCTSKNLCARYDSSIQSLEKRVLRQEARVARFKADAVLACTAP